MRTYAPLALRPLASGASFHQPQPGAAPRLSPEAPATSS
jgi:hypothetical protein